MLTSLSAEKQNVLDYRTCTQDSLNVLPSLSAADWWVGSILDNNSVLHGNRFMSIKRFFKYVKWEYIDNK